MTNVVAEQAPKRASEGNARRSTRISKTVPLSVSGYSKLGNSFLEATSAVSLNCHGCLYPSRYEYQAGSWVTLEMPTEKTNGKTRTVRAQVRFMRLPKSPHELYLVGVELETPANVWGIQSPPEDWLRYPGSLSAGGTTRAGSVTPRPVLPAATPLNVTTEAPRQAAPPSGAVSNGRLAVPPEQVMRMLEGKLQQMAEKVVASTLTAQLGGAIEQAARAVESFTQTSLNQLEQGTAQQSERLVTAACQEFRRRLQADMAQADDHLRKQVEVFLTLAQEAAQRLEKSVMEVKPTLAEAQTFLQETTGEWQDRFSARLRETVDRAGAEFDGETSRVAERQLSRLAEKAQAAATEAATRLDARADGARSQLETAAGTALAEFHVTARGEIEQSIDEARKGVESSLAAFVAEARADWEARQRSCREELVRAGENEVQAFRERLQGVLHSSVVAAMSAVHDHSKSLLDSLAGEKRKSAGGKLLTGLPWAGCGRSRTALWRAWGLLGKILWTAGLLRVHYLVPLLHGERPWPTMGANETPQADSAERRRSHRLLLDVALIVRGESSEGKHFEEETFTISVSAHGALLVLAAKVALGQRIVLMNMQTRTEKEGRVARFGSLYGGLAQVGIEFAGPAPEFWHADYARPGRP